MKSCAYIRMSSDRQDASPEQQREEIRKYALANVYETVARYFKGDWSLLWQSLP